MDLTAENRLGPPRDAKKLRGIRRHDSAETVIARDSAEFDGLLLFDRLKEVIQAERTIIRPTFSWNS